MWKRYNSSDDSVFVLLGIALHIYFRILISTILYRQLFPNININYSLLMNISHSNINYFTSMVISQNSYFYGVDDYIPLNNFSISTTPQDLVFWITMGMHHIPHTEDLPVTPTVGNHLTFFLFPYNYFKECPSMKSRDQVRRWISIEEDSLNNFFASLVYHEG